MKQFLLHMNWEMFINYDEEFLVEVSGANLNKPVITAEVVKKEKWKLA